MDFAQFECLNYMSAIVGPMNSWSAVEIAYFRTQTDLFNERLGEVAAQQGVHFIDVRPWFLFHEVCGYEGEYINHLTLGTRLGWPPLFAKGKSFHPNHDGHQAYANALEFYIEQRINDGWPLNQSGLPVNPPEVTPPTQTASTSSEVYVGELDIELVSPACEQVWATQSNAQVQVQGDGFMPDGSIALTGRLLVGDDVTFAPISADANGQFDIMLTIPTVSEMDAINIQATGIAADGLPQVDTTLTLPILVEQAPCPMDDSFTAQFGTTTSLDVLNNDAVGDAPFDVTTLTIADEPAHGTVSVQASGLLDYQPDGGYVGTDAFTYRICDTADLCVLGHVTLTITIACTITGTDGNDEILGTNGNDVICALGGDDFVSGNGGDDIIIGGTGNDVLFGNAGDDALYGGDGSNIVVGGEGNDIVDGGDDPVFSDDDTTGATPSDLLANFI